MVEADILTPMSDAVLHSAEFEELYRTSHADMVRVAYLITGSLHVAEEVVHDSFIAVADRWGAINTPTAYLRKTVVNRSRSHLRRVQTQRNAPISPQPAVLPEEVDETWQLVQRLPLRKRTAVVLHYYLDLPIDEIAEVMDTRPGTVKSLLHRGRESLRRQLQ